MGFLPENGLRYHANILRRFPAFRQTSTLPRLLARGLPDQPPSQSQLSRDKAASSGTPDDRADTAIALQGQHEQSRGRVPHADQTFDPGAGKPSAVGAEAEALDGQALLPQGPQQFPRVPVPQPDH